jgi:hypothetical protein
MEQDVLQALAGAVLLRDRLAEAGDRDGTYLALTTVDALNRVCRAAGVEPSGRAAVISGEDRPPVPGFMDA